jgi:hypothetical protein
MGAYFIANCITFAARFAIFHYVLFANRGDKAKAAQVLSPSQQLAESDLPQSGQEDAPVSLELAEERRAEPPARR